MYQQVVLVSINKSAYLLTWNPDVWSWEKEYSELLKTVSDGYPVLESWAVSNSSIKEGDVVYLMRLGGEPRGIIAKGLVLSEVYKKEHYDAEQAASGKKITCADIEFNGFLDYQNGTIIPWNILKKRFPNQLWTPNASGIEIKTEYLGRS